MCREDDRSHFNGQASKSMAPVKGSPNGDIVRFECLDKTQNRHQPRCRKSLFPLDDTVNLDFDQDKLVMAPKKGSPKRYIVRFARQDKTLNQPQPRCRKNLFPIQETDNIDFDQYTLIMAPKKESPKGDIVRFARQDTTQDKPQPRCRKSLFPIHETVNIDFAGIKIPHQKVNGTSTPLSQKVNRTAEEKECAEQQIFLRKRKLSTRSQVSFPKIPKRDVSQRISPKFLESDNSSSEISDNENDIFPLGRCDGDKPSKSSDVDVDHAEKDSDTEYDRPRLCPENYVAPRRQRRLPFRRVAGNPCPSVRRCLVFDDDETDHNRLRNKHGKLISRSLVFSPVRQVPEWERRQARRRLFDNQENPFRPYNHLVKTFCPSNHLNNPFRPSNHLINPFRPCNHPSDSSTQCNQLNNPFSQSNHLINPFSPFNHLINPLSQSNHLINPFSPSYHLINPFSPSNHPSEASTQCRQTSASFSPCSDCSFGISDSCIEDNAIHPSQSSHTNSASPTSQSSHTNSPIPTSHNNQSPISANDNYESFTESSLTTSSGQSWHFSSKPSHSEDSNLTTRAFFHNNNDSNPRHESMFS